MAREQLFAAFFFVAFLFLLYQFYRILSFFIGPLSYAALLAFISYPLYAHLLRAVNHRDGLAAGIMTTAVVLLVILPTIWLLTVITTESVSLYRDTEAFIRSGQLQGLLERLQRSWLGDLWLRFSPQLGGVRDNLPEMALNASRTVSGFLVAHAPAAAANVLRAILYFFFTAFTLFFFFRDGERMVRGMRDLIPMDPTNKDAILNRFSETLSAVVMGSVLTAVAQGILGGLAYWALGVPFAVLLAGATGFLSLLPYGGPVVWVGVVIYFGFGGDYVRAAIMAAWGMLAIGSADNVIRPLVIGGRTQIPTVFLFFGILGGLQTYGFLGMFLGPAIIAILVAFARIFREQYATDSPRVVRRRAE